jgi:hypothetical protein
MVLPFRTRPCIADVSKPPLLTKNFESRFWRFCTAGFFFVGGLGGGRVKVVGGLPTPLLYPSWALICARACRPVCRGKEGKGGEDARVTMLARRMGCGRVDSALRTEWTASRMREF